MSISTQIQRLETARNAIRTKLVELGLATSSTKLDELANAVEEITNQGAISVKISAGESYTIPKGYHNGNGKVTGNNHNLQSKTVTPTKKQQSITPDSGYDGLSNVTVEKIPDAYQDVSNVTASASDVLANKVIVTADGTVTAGTMTNNGSTSKTMDGLTTTSVTIPAGYTTGGTVTLTNDIEEALSAI